MVSLSLLVSRFRGLTAVALLVAVCACAPQSAWASTDFVVPPGPQDTPLGITSGPDGNLWFTDSNSRKIGRITTAGVVTTFPITGAIAPVMPNQIVAGPDGRMWFTDTQGGYIGAITTGASAGTVTEYPLPVGNGKSARPVGLTLGADGALWFCESGREMIGRITTTGVITEFATPAGSEPYGIASDKNGNLWYTDFNSDLLREISTAGAALATATIPSKADAGDITKGPDGNMWFVEDGRATGHNVGRVTVGTGSVSEFAMDPTGIGFAITAGPSGTVWFRVKNSFHGDPLAEINTTGTPSVTELNPGSISDIGGMTKGPDNNLWIADGGQNMIFAVTAAGNFVLFGTNSGVALNVGSGPLFITKGPDGNLWFTENLGRAIGKITPSGTVTSTAVPTANNLLAITSGSDGQLWFVDGSGQLLSLATGNGATPVVQSTNFSTPTGITGGPDGNLWVTDISGEIVRVPPANPVGGAMPFFPSAGSVPRSITTGGDGNLWFTDPGNDAIGRITTAGAIKEFPLPQSGLSPFGITPGPDGRLWFQDNSGSPTLPDGNVGAITTSGNASVYPVALSGQSQSIVAGPDGTMWVPDPSAPAIETALVDIGTNGLILQDVNSTYVGSGATGIAVGPDGRLWFTEFNGGRIGRMSAIHGTASAVNALVGVSVNASANFVDGTPVAVATDFTATVDWGDGSSLSAATVSGNQGGPFQVSAAHTYAAAGNYNVVFTLHDSVDNEDYFVSTPGTVIKEVFPTQTALAAPTPASPATAGQTVTFTANVSTSAAALTGNVTFEDFGAPIAGGNVPVNGAGVASFSIVTGNSAGQLSVGPHSITAVYGGDPIHGASGSTALEYVVQTSTQSATTLSLSAIPSARGFRDPGHIVFTATLNNTSATGTVSFYDGPRLLGTGNLSGGVATLSTGAISTGANPVTAVYSGDANNAASFSPVVVVYRSPRPR